MTYCRGEYSPLREERREGKRDGNHIIVHRIVFLVLQIHALKCNQRHSCVTVCVAARNYNQIYRFLSADRIDAKSVQNSIEANNQYCYSTILCTYFLFFFMIDL